MRLFIAAAALACAAPAIAEHAGSPQSDTLRGTHAINGTWRFDPATAKLSDKPERFEIKDGVFSCSTCEHKIRVAADGAFHRVTGIPYWDEIKVDAAAPDRVRYEYRRGGKLVAKTDEVLSADGATLTSSNWSINNMAGKPVEYTATSTRLEPAAAGAHRTSGGWRRASQNVQTADMTRLTFRVTGDTVTITEPTGEAVTAKLNGGFARNKGDVGGTEYAYTAPNDRELIERSRRAGKELSTGRYTVSPDGRTMTAVFTSKRDGGVTTVTATKE